MRLTATIERGGGKTCARWWKSNFLLNLGYADPTQLPPRRPRLDFDDACRVV